MTVEIILHLDSTAVAVGFCELKFFNRVLNMYQEDGLGDGDGDGDGDVCLCAAGHRPCCQLARKLAIKYCIPQTAVALRAKCAGGFGGNPRAIRSALVSYP